MKNIEEINKASVKKILTTKKIPKFFAGDTIKVGVKIFELYGVDNTNVEATDVYSQEDEF